jgi:hypothetical protein
MKIRTLKVRCKLTHEALGMSPSDVDIYNGFVANKVAKEQAAEEGTHIHPTAEDVEKRRTIFPVMADGKTPCILRHQILGMFKDACGMLRRADDTFSKDLKAFKKEIDGLIGVAPDFIPIKLPKGEAVGNCDRSLRAETAQGPRITLASSVTVPAGSTFEFEVKLLKSDLEKYVLEWLDYGEFRGFGGWRNSGKGRFTYEVLKA